VLWLNPQLPDDIRELTFHVRYRGHWIKLTINSKKIQVDFDKGWANPVKIGINGRRYKFSTDDHKEFRLDDPS
jgi:trehalose/maltose hydrolase-like predicted phosphorylase